MQTDQLTIDSGQGDPAWDRSARACAWRIGPVDRLAQPASDWHRRLNTSTEPDCRTHGHRQMWTDHMATPTKPDPTSDDRFEVAALGVPGRGAGRARRAGRGRRRRPAAAPACRTAGRRRASPVARSGSATRSSRRWPPDPAAILLVVMAAIAIFLIWKAIPAFTDNTGNLFTTQTWNPQGDPAGVRHGGGVLRHRDVGVHRDDDRRADRDRHRAVHLALREPAGGHRARRDRRPAGRGAVAGVRHVGAVLPDPEDPGLPEVAVRPTSAGSRCSTTRPRPRPASSASRC